MFERIIALLLYILLLPVLFIFYMVIKLTSQGPFLFKQLRVGRNKTPFTIYKIRTMYAGAEKDQYKFQKINEASGPVFKIKNDPRFTKIGKWLAHTGLDELPQLLHIVKGEMAFVGPRPLFIDEAKKIPKKYEERFSVLPGITSPWVVKGSHKLTFDEWMKLDIEYVRKKDIAVDVKIALKTLAVILHNLCHR